MKLLDEQLAYYRARAREYDKDVYLTPALIREMKGRLARHRRVDLAAELACGTGQWTRWVLSMTNRLTVVDGSPEMLRIARKRVGTQRVRYVQADLFKWKPDERYGLIFFGNWLSHVPPRRLLAFLRNVRDALQPGGRILIADHDARIADYGDLNPKQIRRTRELHDGRKFGIVKVFYELGFLRDLLTALGFRVVIHRIGMSYFALSAVLRKPRAAGKSAVGRERSASRKK